MEKNSKVKVGLIQMSMEESGDANLKKAVELASQAADQGAQIICLPELFRQRYFPAVPDFDVSSFAEPIPGETTSALSVLARETGTVIIAPIYEKDFEGKLFNTAVTIDSNGSLAGIYRKIHIPQDEHFYEKNYFAPGDNGYVVCRTKHADFAVLICYDQWFPEAARAAALSGAQILFYPTAIGNIKNHAAPEGNWQDAWQTVQRGHAIANSAHVCAVNRCGEEGVLDFWGGSFACDAFGNIIAKAGGDEQVLVVDLNLAMNTEVRNGWGFFANRRPDTYKTLCD